MTSPPPTMRESELNRRLRAADWRFLLNLSRKPTSICFGPRRLASAVQLVSTPVQPGAAPVDLVALGNPSSRSLAAAWRCLRPGGALYVECRKPRLGPARLQRQLVALGFVDVRWYVPCPWPSRAPKVWLPHDLAERDRRLSAGNEGSRRGALAAVLWRLLRRLGIVFPLHLVARRPGDGDSDIADLISEKWSEWGLSDRPDRLSWVLLTGGQRSTNKVVALVAGDCGPRLAVKFSRSESEESALRREYEALRIVEQTRPHLPGAPRALFLGHRSGRLCVGETALAGSQLMRQLNTTSHRELAARVTDWLIELAGTSPPTPRSEWWSRLVESPLQRFETSFRSVVSDDELAATRSQLSRLCDLPLVPEHRDCSPWNILLDGRGRLGVLDWESAERAGLPALDLVYFLTYSALVIEDAFALPAARQAYARTRDPATRTGGVVAACEHRYIEALDIAPVVIAPLRLLCWIVHSESEYRRLQQDGAGRPDTEALARSVFLALWREEMQLEC